MLGVLIYIFLLDLTYSQTLQFGSSDKGFVVNSPKFEVKDGCNSYKSESRCDQTSQDWNEEVGSLFDDDVAVTEITDSNERSDSLLASFQKNQGENKARPSKRLQHHLSWQDAMKKAKSLPDPWEKFHIDDSCPTEVAVRHRYNAVKKNWVRDEVRVKMEALVSNMRLFLRLCWILVKVDRSLQYHSFELSICFNAYVHSDGSCS